MRKPSSDTVINSVMVAFLISYIFSVIYKVVPAIRADGLVDSVLSFQWFKPLLFGSMFIPIVLMTALISILIVLACMFVTSSASEGE